MCGFSVWKSSVFCYGVTAGLGFDGCDARRNLPTALVVLAAALAVACVAAVCSQCSAGNCASCSTECEPCRVINDGDGLIDCDPAFPLSQGTTCDDGNACTSG